MSIINPKFRISVYKDIEFKEEPYDTAKKFAIYIPKPKDVIGELLEKHEQSVKARNERIRKFQLERQQEREKLAALKTRTMNTSPKNSPTSSPVKPADAQVTPAKEKTTGFEVKKVIDFDDVIEEPESESKLKSKLRREVEMARTIDDDINRREVQFDETQNKSEMFQSYQGNQLADSMNDRMYQTADARSFKSANTNKSFRSRATSQKSFRSSFIKTSKLRSTLYYDPRTHSVPKTSLKNKVIDDILDKEDMVLSNPVLYQSILKLRDMQLLKLNEPRFQKFPGVGKINYVYNDYHARNTNPGYSRNTAGAFYCR